MSLALNVDQLKERIGKSFHCTKLGATKTAVLTDVIKDKVLLKRSPEAKDSFYMPLTKFIKFYSEVI